MPDEANGTRSSVDVDVARIEAMREAGTVTAEEAERLIEVLREIATAESDIESIDEAPAPPPPAPPAPSEARVEAGKNAAPTADAAPEAAPAPASAAAPRGDADARSWLRVQILAGDVRIRGGDVTEPELRSGDDGAVLEREADGWVVRDTREGWFGRTMGTNVDVTLPRSMGVRLAVKAGDVSISDVAAVAGKMLAGDLRIDGADAIDVHKSAGDLEAKVRLTRGRHRIRASAGDVNVTLLPGSDVAFEASVTMGDVGAGSAFKRVRSGMGGSVAGRVGSGTASLEVRLSAGDVRIRSEEPHG